MITILLSNGECVQWKAKEYTDYDIKGRFFVIIDDDQWVGMYALDQIVFVEVEKEKEKKKKKEKD